MAKKRRPSPTEDDINRIAETMRNDDNFHIIKNKYTFDKVYDDYLEETGLIENKKVRGKVWDVYKEQYSDRLEEFEERKITKKGKQVKVTKFTTEQGEFKPKRKLTKLGRIKGKIVYTEPTAVLIRGHSYARYRDRLGRFASIKPIKRN
jgi:hypothetical protein